MDADQTMRQRALELASAYANSVGEQVDLSLASEYYKFIKSGTMPQPPAEGE